MPLNEERSSEVDIKRFMNQDVIVGSVENSPSLNRYAYVEGNPVNYLDPFGLEKWESPYKNEHELMDGWSRNLMIVNALSVAVTIAFTPAGVLTEPLLVLTNLIGIGISVINFELYFADLVDAVMYGSEEDVILALDGMEWSAISISLGIFGFSNVVNGFGKYSYLFSMSDSTLEAEHQKNLAIARRLKKIWNSYVNSYIN